MPIYTYRREDGTTFEVRQKFSDDPLKVDPETGQSVHRVPQAAGIVFKGSGFYVTDNSKAKKVAKPKSDESKSDSTSKTESTSKGSNDTKPSDAGSSAAD